MPKRPGGVGALVLRTHTVPHPLLSSPAPCPLLAGPNPLSQFPPCLFFSAVFANSSSLQFPRPHSRIVSRFILIGKAIDGSPSPPRIPVDGILAATAPPISKAGNIAKACFTIPVAVAFRSFRQRSDLPGSSRLPRLQHEVPISNIEKARPDSNAQSILNVASPYAPFAAYHQDGVQGSFAPPRPVHPFQPVAPFYTSPCPVANCLPRISSSGNTSSLLSEEEVSASRASRSSSSKATSSTSMTPQSKVRTLPMASRPWHRKHAAPSHPRGRAWLTIPVSRLVPQAVRHRR